MSEKKEMTLLDYLVIIIKHKKNIFGTSIIAVVIFYLFLFFLVEEQFDATATVVPSQDNSFAGLAGAIGGLADIPFDLGGFDSNPEIGMYNTILQSRSNAERVIEKYNLWEVYDLDRTEPKDVKEARETFLGSLDLEENEDGAYIITMRTPDPLLSATITNDLVNYLNDRIIELKVEKSKNNRIFLEKRLEDVRIKLANSEDSLKIFQKESGLLNPEEQFKGIISAYSEIEQKLITKQIERDILEELLPEESPQLRDLNLELKYFSQEIQKLKQEGRENSIFVPYASIPDKAINYYRYYREVEINNKILEFILPLYEQAKVEEQKEIPILQVIDNAIPPEEKSYPPRLPLTLIVGLGIFTLTFSYVLLKENSELQSNKNVQYIRANLFKWKSR